MMQLWGCYRPKTVACTFNPEGPHALCTCPAFGGEQDFSAERRDGPFC